MQENYALRKAGFLCCCCCCCCCCFSFLNRVHWQNWWRKNTRHSRFQEAWTNKLRLNKNVLSASTVAVSAGITIIVVTTVDIFEILILLFGKANASPIHLCQKFEKQLLSSKEKRGKKEKGKLLIMTIFLQATLRRTVHQLSPSSNLMKRTSNSVIDAAAKTQRDEKKSNQVNLSLLLLRGSFFLISPS